jgi:dihydroorotase
MLTRRDFVAASTGCALAKATSGQTRERLYDILIKNGDVRDPVRGYKARADVAILDGKIAVIETAIPAEKGRDVIDARGLYVVPGLIDLHTHIYYGGGAVPSIEPDPVAALSGVTTWVDAGSYGYDNFAGFRRYIVDRSQVRIFGFVYLYPASRNPVQDPVKYVRSVMRQTGEAASGNRDILLGVKVQIGSNMQGRYSMDFLKIARELCDNYKLKLMVHVSDAPPEPTQIMELMRPGDIITHSYTGHGTALMDAQGKLKSGVAEARSRGVVFDLGHGLGSFNFAEARKCLQAGFAVDTISTDLYALNINGPVYDMPTTMSKLLYLGMSFDDVLLRSTVNPAKVIARVEGLGELRVGSPADVALLALEDGEFRLVDSQRNAVTARQRIVSRLTICRGKRLVAPL